MRCGRAGGECGEAPRHVCERGPYVRCCGDRELVLDDEWFFEGPQNETYVRTLATIERLARMGGYCKEAMR